MVGRFSGVSASRRCAASADGVGGPGPDAGGAGPRREFGRTWRFAGRKWIRPGTTVVPRRFRTWAPTTRPAAVGLLTEDRDDRTLRGVV